MSEENPLVIENLQGAVTVDAKFKVNSYSVKYDPNGGEGEIEPGEKVVFTNRYRKNLRFWLLGSDGAGECVEAARMKHSQNFCLPLQPALRHYGIITENYDSSCHH